MRQIAQLYFRLFLLQTDNEYILPGNSIKLGRRANATFVRIRKETAVYIRISKDDDEEINSRSFRFLKNMGPFVKVI